MSAPTATQIGLLQHTLGINEHRREPYRNHFVASAGHHDMKDLVQLEAAGLMTRGHVPAFLPSSSIVFYTTEAGRVLAITSLPAPKKRTRYQEYRHSESMDSFGEWLCGRLPEYESRKAYGNGPRDRWGYEYRMYRVDHCSYAYRRDIEGDWAPTKKEAKASYKATLKKRQQQQREWAGSFA